MKNVILFRETEKLNLEIFNLKDKSGESIR